MMFTPTNLDESKTAAYPIINNAYAPTPKVPVPAVSQSSRQGVAGWCRYPGPQSGSVGSRAWSAARGDRQALAELGFVVVSIDGRGNFRPGKKLNSYRDSVL